MAQERGYQHHLSKEYSALKDIKGRTQKFEKIMSVLQDFNPGIQRLRCLDIGCSSGIITSLLGDHFRMSVGMDIDQEAVQYAKTRSPSTRAQFLISDAMALPFKDH